MSLTETKEINGRKYTIRKLPGIPGRKMLLRLTKVAAPLLGGADSKDFEEGGGSEINVKALISECLDRLTESEFEYVINGISQDGSVRLDGDVVLDLSRSDTQDDIWSANYGEMFEFLQWALKVNFGSFLDGLQVMARKRAKRSNATGTPKETT